MVMRMQRRGVAILITTAAVASAGLGWRVLDGGRATADAAPAATVTPKMQAPPEARSLSRAFSAVAKALRPSVVRIDIEVDQPRVARNDRKGRSDPELRDFFQRFFDFDFEDGAPFPNP